MAISLPDARRLSDDVLQALRFRALHGCELGDGETEVADLLGVSRETVSRWWTAFAEDGLDALPGDRTGRPVGSGRTLCDEQARRIQELIDDRNPEELGIAAALVDPQGRARPDPQRVRDRPCRCGPSASTSSGGATRPRCRAVMRKDQDPEEVREWLEETYPAIEERAAREGAEIHWCDETGAAADGSRPGLRPRGGAGDG